jgi:GxxExxY protein
MSQVHVPADIETLATTVVNAAFAVHKSLGPGLLESAYHECLAIELSLAGVQCQRELSLPLTYRGHVVLNSYRVDMIVNEVLLIELKAIDAVQPIHRVQTTTYLRLLKLPLGLLINFNVPLIRDGITRVLNLDFRGDTSPTLASSRLRA